MTTDQVKDLISTALNDVFTNRGKKLAPIYPKFLKEFKTDSAQLITMDQAYFGETPRKEEAEGFTYEQVEFGNKRTTEASGFGMGFRVSKEALIALSKKPYGEFSTAKIASMQRITEAMRDSENHTKEIYAAELIKSAASAVQTEKWIGAGRDGLALAATNHKIKKNPETAWSNLMTAATFSQTTIGDMLSAIETTPSDEGFLRPLPKRVKLVIGPKLRHKAYEINKTTSGLDTTSDNVNYLNDFGFDIIVNPYLGATSTAYAIITDEARIGYFAPVSAEFDDEEDFETRGHKYSMYFQYGVDFLDPHGFILNAGL